MCTATFANTKNEFKYALNSLQYDLTVEWDQKDNQVFNRMMNQFQDQLQQLKNKGLSNEDIKEILLEKVIDPKLKEVIVFQASLHQFDDIKNLSQFAWEKRDGLYASGASWNGDVVLKSVLAFIFVGLIVLAIYDHIYPNEYICTERGDYACMQRVDCALYDEYGMCIEDGDTYETCGYPCVSGYNSRKKN